MKEFGGIVILGGAVAIAIAIFGMDSTVSTYGSYGGLVPERVANLHGMHRQSMTFYGGWAAMIFGMIIVGFGLIVGRLDAISGATSATKPAPSAYPVPSTAPSTGEPVEPADIYEPVEEDPVGRMIGRGVVGAVVLVFIIVVVLAILSSGRPATQSTSAMSNDFSNDVMMDANAMDMGMDDAINQAENDIRNVQR